MSIPSFQRVQESGKAVRSGMRQVHELTIANTDDTSNAVDLLGEVPVGIIIKDAWTAADIVVEVSFDGDDFYPVVDHEGNLVVAAAEEDVYIALPVQMLLGSRYVRLVSVDQSDATVEVPQGAAREILLITMP